jgi:hypothetical protein
MLFAYKNGRVTGKLENQSEIVYFVTSAEKIAGDKLSFAFADGHPIKEPKAFYDDLAMLSQVDFPLMLQTYWNDTDDDPDRMRRRQAEFLVWERVPLGSIIGMATKTAAKCAEVTKLVRKHTLELPCVVKSGWYYS